MVLRRIFGLKRGTRLLESGEYYVTRSFML
jgi:hypothetical protein